MKNTNVRTVARLFVFLVSIFLVDLSPSYAQIGPLGIYGSPPSSYRDSVRYVRLDEYPAIMDGIQYTIPVNGLKNFNFYYKPDGTGFVPAGDYTVNYMDAGFNGLGGEYVTYSPNSGHTNGVQVANGFVSPPSTPRGVHGTVLAYIPNGGGATTPLSNATVVTNANGAMISIQARTNANGFFSIYYDNGNFAQLFPPVTHWSLSITGSMNGCNYNRSYGSSYVFWNPLNTSKPSLPTYYVDDAEFDAAIQPIAPSAPCSL